jgi:hypothetical protein
VLLKLWAETWVNRKMSWPSVRVTTTCLEESRASLRTLAHMEAAAGENTAAEARVICRVRGETEERFTVCNHTDGTVSCKICGGQT